MIFHFAADFRQRRHDVTLLTVTSSRQPPLITRWRLISMPPDAALFFATCFGGFSQPCYAAAAR